jgi:hypothetical protein
MIEPVVILCLIPTLVQTEDKSDFLWRQGYVVRHMIEEIIRQLLSSSQVLFCLLSVLLRLSS